MNTIKEQWEFFSNLCLTEASEKEREQAKVAFHAGVMSLLKTQIEMSEKGLDAEGAAAQYARWTDEMAVYAKERIAKFKALHPNFKPH